MERTSLETPETPPPSLAAGLRKRPSAVFSSPTQTPKAIRKEFWTSSVQERPIHECSPWKFYEPFLETGTDTLVLCNDRTEIRALRSYSKTTDHTTTFRQIRHVNFVYIYEVYSFEDQTYGVLEYMDLSLTDLLSYVNLTEPEIAYIIGQVSTPPPSLLLSVKMAGASCHKIYHIKEYYGHRCSRRRCLDLPWRTSSPDLLTDCLRC